MSTKLTPAQRFWAKVRITDTCWIWEASTDTVGYGLFRDGKLWKAHRWAYQFTVGPVTGLELDHLCRVAACVNPDHLEPVTHAENVSRGISGARFRIRAACSYGHRYELGSFHTTPKGERVCYVCRNAWRKQETCKNGHPLAAATPNTRGYRNCQRCTHERMGCRRGHIYVEGSYKVRPWGARECLVCARLRKQVLRNGQHHVAGPC